MKMENHLRNSSAHEHYTYIRDQHIWVQLRLEMLKFHILEQQPKHTIWLCYSSVQLFWF